MRGRSWALSGVVEASFGAPKPGANLAPFGRRRRRRGLAARAHIYRAAQAAVSQLFTRLAQEIEDAPQT